MHDGSTLSAPGKVLPKTRLIDYLGDVYSFLFYRLMWCKKREIKSFKTEELNLTLYEALAKNPLNYGGEKFQPGHGVGCVLMSIFIIIFRKQTINH